MACLQQMEQMLKKLPDNNTASRNLKVNHTLIKLGRRTLLQEVSPVRLQFLRWTVCFWKLLLGPDRQLEAELIMSGDAEPKQSRCGPVTVLFVIVVCVSQTEKEAPNTSLTMRSEESLIVCLLLQMTDLEGVCSCAGLHLFTQTLGNILASHTGVQSGSQSPGRELNKDRSEATGRASHTHSSGHTSVDLTVGSVILCADQIPLYLIPQGKH